jgi:uncharacterized protein (TIGR02611 family)
MIDQAKRTWQAFRRSQPGYRFQERYNRRQQTTSGPFDPKNVVYLLAGIAIIVVGVVLAPIPGPGGIIAFVGLALIGAEFLPIARALDWGELRIRGVVRWARNMWRVLPLGIRVGIGLLAALIVVVVGYGAYQVVLGG